LTLLTITVRDEYEQKKEEFEKQLSEALGTTWTIDIDPKQVYAYAGDGYVKDSLGACIAS